MDIRMEGMTGLEAGRLIMKEFPAAKILLLTTFSDDEYIVKAIQMGAKGYILKQDFESIAPAINAVYNGQTVFGGEVMTRIPSLMSDNGKNTTPLPTSVCLTRSTISSPLLRTALTTGRSQRSSFLVKVP